MEPLRKPPFFVASALLGLALLTEFGVTLAAAFVGESGGAVGWAIPTLALVDIQLAFTALLMAAPLIFPAALTGRIQGIATFVVALVITIVSIVAGLLAFALLSKLILFLTTGPPGQLKYISGGYFDFPNGAAAAALALIMACKLGSIATLLLAHQRFLQNKGLVLLVATSLLATILISFLHGFVPGFLASVSDAIAAIIVAVLALLWAVLGLIFGGIAIVRSLA